MKRLLQTWRVYFGVLVVVIPQYAFSAVEETRVESPDGSSWGALLIITEGFAFGAAALSRSENGARLVGAIDGMSGSLVLGKHILAEGDNPGFEIPYAIGLLGMSYYNFTNASAADSDDKFKTNVVGVNAVIVIASMIGAYQLNKSSQNSIAMGSNPSGFNVRIAFLFKPMMCRK